MNEALDLVTSQVEPHLNEETLNIPNQIASRFECEQEITCAATTTQVPATTPLTPIIIQSQSEGLLTINTLEAHAESEQVAGKL